MAAERNHIKVFVASTVYNFQSDLDRIYNLLDGYGYDVLMSHKGTIPLDSSKSNAQVCTDGVEECDVFLGFIRPDYGSGVLERGGMSITHMEFQTAMKRNIPSTIVYLQNDEKKTIKGLIETMSVIDGFEYLILTTKEQIKLDTVLTFNGRRHKEEE